MKGGTILGVLLLSSVRTTLWKEACGKASAVERLIPLVAVESASDLLFQHWSGLLWKKHMGVTSWGERYEVLLDACNAVSEAIWGRVSCYSILTPGWTTLPFHPFWHKTKSLGSCRPSVFLHVCVAVAKLNPSLGFLLS